MLGDVVLGRPPVPPYAFPPTPPTDDLLAAIVESSSDAIVAEDLDGLVIGWNRAAERLYGWRADDILGRSIDLVIPEERRDETAVIRSAIGRAETVAPIESERIAKLGTRLLVRAHYSPIVDRDGRLVGLSTLTHEVGEHHRVRDALTASAARYHALVDSLTDADRFQRFFDSNILPICYGDGDRILDGNRAFLELLGIRRRDLAGGCPLSQLLSSSSAAAEGPHDFRGGGASEYQFTRANGEPGYVLVGGFTLEPEPGWLAVAVDLTERRTAEDHARHLSLHDPLTGLPNRRVLVDRLDRALDRETPGEDLVAVLFCDIDNFKRVNDDHGHGYGDQVLHAVARRLEHQARTGDTVARVGGDEFIVVLEDLASVSDASRIAERFRAAVAEPVTIEGWAVEVTCSIGVAVTDHGLEDVDSLLQRADRAMYRAKQNGRNRVVTIAGEAVVTNEAVITSEAVVTSEVRLAVDPEVDLRVS